MKKLLFILVVFSAVGLASCKEGCYQPARSLAGVAFMDSVTRTPYTVTGLTVQGVGSDSILYNNVSVNAVYLPLHVTKDTTEYIFKFAPASEGTEAVEYTLSIYHTITPQFISPECGCVPTYTIQEFKASDNSSFKYSELYNAEVKNVEQDVHIKIYY